MSTQNEYDVLVVGGRAAGASVAQLLARQGRRVLVVDRDEFPSDTMSTHFMNPGAVGVLERLGVLNDVLAAGFRRVTRHRTWIDDCCFEGPAGPPGTFSLGPRRIILDSILLDHAVKAGAQFEQRTRVDGLLHEEGRVAGAVLQTTGGERREVRARVVIGADGKSSKVAEWVGAEKYDEVPALRPAYYAYFHGIEPRPEATLELFFGGDNIGFLFPMREGEDCVAVEIQPEEFDAYRSGHAAFFEARIRKLPEMARRMQNAHIEGKVSGVKGIDNYFRKPFGPGWALTGDAGYLKDPSSGLGIGDALEQSFMLADALGGWFDGADWEATMSAFQQKRDQTMKPMYKATLAFTRMRDMTPAEQNLLKAVFLSPGMTRALAHSIVAQLPSLLSPGAHGQTVSISKMFAPAPEPAKT
ncbi:MAG TPA: NAD(P)/FAD-dependent oxidoreductase [Candidatus Angelobacter sp.]|nr:NAD(P)/FAD-dependent oxidoreductase [Candidatus Angelobacter sp.]